MKRVWLWAPLAVFALFVAVVAWRLATPVDPTHASKLIGKPLPAFALPRASSSRPGLARDDFSGQPRLLNVFASWCVPCVAEAPVLAELARRGAIIEGVAIRDRRADVDAFLTKNGNPFRAIGADPTSRLQIALGSAGVPETFVIDARGIIRYQHIGDIRPEQVPAFLAMLEKAR